MNPRILVIDDEPNILKMMELVLSGAGFEVTTATFGTEGLERFGNGKSFDAVVCDYKMPDMSGIEVEQEMLQRDADAKVIIVSGYGGIDTALNAMNRGASDFLRKPFAPVALIDTVRKTLAQGCKQTPLNAVFREFSRQDVNGFNFEIEKVEVDEAFGDITYSFEVQGSQVESRFVKVVFTAIAQELVKAYIDADEVPCGNRFFEAMAEERLSSYLLEHGSVPPSALIRIEDIGSSEQKWIDSLMTISVA